MSSDAVVHGTEQRINRNLFKIAVELGKLSHMLAAANDVDEDTLQELHEIIAPTNPKSNTDSRNTICKSFQFFNLSTV